MSERYEEDNYSLEPHTEAGRRLKEAFDSQGGSIAWGADDPVTFEAHMDARVSDLMSGHYYPVETVEAQLFDYTREGVVFDEQVYEVPAAETYAGGLAFPDKSFLGQIGRSVFEAGLTEEADEMITLSGSLTIPKPAVLFEQAKAVAQEAGDALLETLRETLEVDKEAVAAVAFVCGQIILQYSEYLGTTSIADLVVAIKEDYPELLKEPQFGSALRRLRKNREDFMQSIDDLKRKETALELVAEPALYNFCEKHAINPSQVLEI